jgi:hypothetical protein
MAFDKQEYWDARKGIIRYKDKKGKEVVEETNHPRRAQAGFGPRGYISGPPVTDTGWELGDAPRAERRAVKLADLKKAKKARKEQSRQLAERQKQFAT